MRKKINIFIFIILIMLVPTTVLAGDCSTPIISGGGSSGATGGSGGSGCEDSVCLSTNASNYVGVRVQIYKYSGNGNITLIGKGVDIWATNGINSSSYHFSSPGTNNLATKASCTKGDGSNSYGKNLKNIYPLSSSQYLSGNYGTITYDTQVKTYYNNGTIIKYLLQYSNGNPTSGWIKTNLLDKLMANTTKANNELKSLFNLTDAQIEDIKKNSDDYYLSAEMLYRFWINSANPGRYVSSYKGTSNHYYLGTASEAGYLHGYVGIYRALYQDSAVGKLVSSNGKIKTVSLISSPTYYNDYTAINGGANAYAACSSAYGLSIWNLGVVCEECGKSCETECGSLSETSKRACAIKYCKENENGDYTNCVNKCSTTNITGGCPSGMDSGVCTTNKSTGSRDCNTNSSTSVELTSNVCYDDSTTYKVGNDTFTNYNQLQIKYYKIECEEKVKLFSLPSKQQILVTKNETANLYLGYGMTYSKNCELSYKNSAGTGWVKEDNKTESSYSSSNMLIKNDIAIYKKYMNDNKSNTEIYNIYKDAYNQLVKVYEMSKNRLTMVSALDYSNKKMETSGKVEIVDSSLSSTKSTDVTMLPVYCEKGSSTVGIKSSSTSSNSKCVLTKNNVYYDDQTGRVICGDNGTAKATVTTTGSSYSYTVYYGLDSSWISAFSSNPGTVYHDKNQCLTAVNSSNGMCIEKENVWVFDPFTESVSINKSISQVTSGEYTINLSNYGSCGQFKYTYKCEYNLENSELCTTRCIDQYNSGVISKSEYDSCFNKYCSCNAYCGSNVACRAKYCPEECEGCDNVWEKDDEDEVCDDCVNKCNNDYSKNSIQNVNCKYDCCNMECSSSNKGCLYNCCATRCATKRDLGLFEKEGVTKEEGYKACIQECDCPNGNCGGDYYYRTIDLERPFPGGTGLTREPGANWYNKVKYITESENPNSIYTDKTDGKSADYEYKIILKSDDIKKIKNDKNINTTYTQYNRSKTATNGNVYCSYILHDYLKDNNITLEAGTSGIVGSGCKNKQ